MATKTEDPKKKLKEGDVTGVSKLTGNVTRHKETTKAESLNEEDAKYYVDSKDRETHMTRYSSNTKKYGSKKAGEMFNKEREERKLQREKERYSMKKID